MKSNYLFHGTSLANARAILANGFDGDEGKQLWNVSGGYNYFWSLKDILKSEGEEASYAAGECLRRASDATQTAMVHNEDFTPVILVVDAAQVDYEPDDSCDNMDGAVMSRDTVPREAILKVFKGKDFTFLGAVMASQSMEWLEQNPYSNEVHLDNEALTMAAEALKGKTDEIYVSEMIEEAGWDEFTPNEFSTI